MPRPRKLSERQRRFVSEYLVDLNATQAAIRAGYSVRNADKIGSQLLGKTRVSEAIAAAQSERASRVELTADEVVRRLDVESRREGEGSSHSARVAALKLLGEHFGLFDAKSPLRVDVTSGGKPLEHNTLTVGDLTFVAGLVAEARRALPSDGGSQPVDPA